MAKEKDEDRHTHNYQFVKQVDNGDGTSTVYEECMYPGCNDGRNYKISNG